MFDSLKNKISNAIKGFSKKEKEEIEEENQEIVNNNEEHQKQEEENQENIKEYEQLQNKDNNKNIKEINKEYNKKEETLKIGLSINTKIRKVFLNSVKLNESDINQFLETLKISLLQSDISFSTTDQFLESLNIKLKESKFSSKGIDKQIIEYVKSSLMEILNKNEEKHINLWEFIEEKIKIKETPIKILFIGPNGTGKTTTIAKIANNLKQKHITSVLSASDTFRAAAIEQTEYHANKVGIPVIKSKYGADPASVAFDAINYAKAHSINVVLIDSAGRQETNTNLINEMKKMVRITKPDLTIFVGESISGNIISEQINEFSKFIEINGIILTKLDCDAKGGNTISIAHDTNIPILFIGTGESYDALINFDPKSIVNFILPNN